MHHSLDLRSKTKQQIILLKQLIHKKRPGAPSSFYKCRQHYLVLLRARDKNTNCGKREETDIGSKSSAQSQRWKSKGYKHVTGGRENSIANQKDNDIESQMVFLVTMVEGAHYGHATKKSTRIGIEVLFTSDGYLISLPQRRKKKRYRQAIKRPICIGDPNASRFGWRNDLGAATVEKEILQLSIKQN